VSIFFEVLQDGDGGQDGGGPVGAAAQLGQDLPAFEDRRAALARVAGCGDAAVDRFLVGGQCLPLNGTVMVGPAARYALSASPATACRVSAWGCRGGGRRSGRVPSRGSAELVHSSRPAASVRNWALTVCRRLCPL